METILERRPAGLGGANAFASSWEDSCWAEADGLLDIILVNMLWRFEGPGELASPVAGVVGVGTGSASSSSSKMTSGSFFAIILESNPSFRTDFLRIEIGFGFSAPISSSSSFASSANGMREPLLFAAFGGTAVEALRCESNECGSSAPSDSDQDMSINGPGLDLDSSNTKPPPVLALYTLGCLAMANCWRREDLRLPDDSDKSCEDPRRSASSELTDRSDDLRLVCPGCSFGELTNMVGDNTGGVHFGASGCGASGCGASFAGLGASSS